MAEAIRSGFIWKLTSPAFKIPYKRRRGKKTSNGKHLKIDGIEFKSSLEVYCYKELKKAGINFKYEPTSFKLTDDCDMPFTVYKKTQKSPIHPVKSKRNRGISYTPDFVIYEGKDIVYVIETKGFANESFSIRVKLWYNYCIKNLPKLKAYFLPSNQKEVDFCMNTITNENK